MVITRPEFASGFHLAGVDVETVSDPRDASEIIRRIIWTRSDFGIIAIDEDLSVNLDPALKKELDEKGLPFIIPFPAAELYTWMRQKREQDYTSQMVRDAIGYHIKLKRD
jgi:vacuolar-type H+-ATPase subunit F/Vma7